MRHIVYRYSFPIQHTHTHCFPKMLRHKLTHTLTYISKRKNIVIASFGFKRFPGLQTLHCPERGLFSGHTYNELIKLLVMCICVSMVILSACVVFFFCIIIFSKCDIALKAPLLWVRLLSL